MATTPTNDIIRKKQAVPAERTNNFFRSKRGLARLKKKYFRFTKMRQNPNSNPASSRETVNRSSVMVTEGSSELFRCTMVDSFRSDAVVSRVQQFSSI